MKNSRYGLAIFFPFLIFACLADELYAADRPKCLPCAESVIDYLDSWENVYRAYNTFLKEKSCYDGAVAEGFSEAISSLWEKQWEKLSEMTTLSTRDRAFREFLLARISDETIPRDRFQTIVNNARNRCPHDSQEFCNSVMNAAKR